MSPHQVALDAKAHNGERISITHQRRQDFVLVEHNSNPRVGGSLDICESTSFNIGPKCSLIAHPLRSFHDKVVLDLHISH